ncbi:MAG: single-stranded DNA-binding protein [Prevotellaceae bacterium]|nr:single-stranded DNA-binding protein [Prevotellaceae bacterium]
MALNKVFLIGNVGRDPEVHYFDSNSRKTSFTLATTERGFVSRDGQQIPDRTEWHNIVLWRGLAEIGEKYIRKGSKIFIEGKITTRSYEDKTGIKRYVTEIVGENLELLDKREKTESSEYGAPAQPQGAYSAPSYSAPAQPATSPAAPAFDEPVAAPEGTDDLPF